MRAQLRCVTQHMRLCKSAYDDSLIGIWQAPIKDHGYCIFRFSKALQAWSPRCHCLRTCRPLHFLVVHISISTKDVPLNYARVPRACALQRPRPHFTTKHGFNKQCNLLGPAETPHFPGLSKWQDPTADKTRVSGGSVQCVYKVTIQALLSLNTS